MNGKSVALVVVLGVLGSINDISCNEAAPSKGEAARLNELRTIAEHLKEVIKSKDIDSLIGYVKHDLLLYEDMKHDLHDSESRLYGHLFDSDVLNRHVRSNRKLISIRDYFLKAESLKIVVGFSEDETKKKLDWGWIAYQSSNFSKEDWPPLTTLYYTNGRWWITQLFDAD